MKEKKNRKKIKTKKKIIMADLSQSGEIQFSLLLKSIIHSSIKAFMENLWYND